MVEKRRQQELSQLLSVKTTSPIAQNPQHHNKTKHIDIKYHYVREKVMDTTTYDIVQRVTC